jgi:ATP-dependent RNA helicase DDX19/DBP5
MAQHLSIGHLITSTFTKSSEFTMMLDSGTSGILTAQPQTQDDIKMIINDVESPLFPDSAWEELLVGNRSCDLIQGLYELDFDGPSRIQCQAIPVLTQTKPPQSLLIQAQSGSGKTIAFLCSMFLKVDPHLKELQTICLAHTMELVEQIFQIALSLNERLLFDIGYTANRDYDVITGSDKESHPEVCPQMLFGTPASVVTTIREKKLSVAQVKLLILDEADRLLRPSDRQGDFIQCVERLVKCLPKKGQKHHPAAILPPNIPIGFFSASYTARSVEVIKLFRPDVVEIKKKQVPKVISHYYVVVTSPDPEAEAQHIVRNYYQTIAQSGQVIVFLSKKENSNTFQQAMNQAGYDCKVTHGDISKPERKQIIADFRAGKFKLLVGSDLIARGIDVPEVYLVVQVGISRTVYLRGRTENRPNFIDYQHRAGRAGRFGRMGVSISIITPQEVPMVKLIEEELEITIEERKASQAIPSEDLAPTEAAAESVVAATAEPTVAATAKPTMASEPTE